MHCFADGGWGGGGVGADLEEAIYGGFNLTISEQLIEHSLYLYNATPPPTL